VPIIARQFGRPCGTLGRLIGHGTARANAGFSRWVIQQIAGHYRGSTGRIAELGPGPGIGLQTVLRQYPQARVRGINLSPEMLSQSRKRNLAELRAGRLTLTEGSAASLAAIARSTCWPPIMCSTSGTSPPMSWRKSAAARRPVDPGLPLKQNMPQMAQRHFPPQGHLLYSSDEQVTRLLAAAGLTANSHHLKGPPAAPHGRVALATS
jgi:hypothetical protein